MMIAVTIGDDSSYERRTNVLTVQPSVHLTDGDCNRGPTGRVETVVGSLTGT